jgi:hypothetical protein
LLHGVGFAIAQPLCLRQLSYQLSSPDTAQPKLHCLVKERFAVLIRNLQNSLLLFFQQPGENMI